MKVRLTSDQLGRNPEFNSKEPVTEENPLNVIVPKGTEIEHPEALFFLINEQAEPVDQEAKDAWKRHLEKVAKTKAQRAAHERPAIITPPKAEEKQKTTSTKAAK